MTQEALRIDVFTTLMLVYFGTLAAVALAAWVADGGRYLAAQRKRYAQAMRGLYLEQKADFRGYRQT